MIFRNLIFDFQINVTSVQIMSKFSDVLHSKLEEVGPAVYKRLTLRTHEIYIKDKVSFR